LFKYAPGTAIATLAAMALRTILTAACLVVWTSAPALAQSTLDELNESGWALVQQGDGVRAARMFADALSLKPDDPVLLFGAGVAAHLRGQSKEALATLQRALKIEPSLVSASLVLGEIAYREGEVDLAITTYEKALKYAPRNRSLLESLDAWRADAEASRGLEERRYDRFRVLFQGRADEALARKATEVLEAAFWKIEGTLGSSPSEPVVVVLYTEKQFRDVTRAPDWAGGVYDGRILVAAAGAALSPRDFERVLVHELAHAMIAALAPRGVPAWLHEGLAQHFEGKDTGAARRRVKGFGRTIPLRNLERGFTRLNAAEAEIAYLESLVAVDAMLRHPNLSWTGLLRALSESNRAEYTLGTFGLSYADLEGEFAP
jgi:tetratricopeptide (TPR) repeat protein